MGLTQDGWFFLAGSSVVVLLYMLANLWHQSNLKQDGKPITNNLLVDTGFVVVVIAVLILTLFQKP